MFNTATDFHIFTPLQKQQENALLRLASPESNPLVVGTATLSRVSFLFVFIQVRLKIKYKIFLTQ